MSTVAGFRFAYVDAFARFLAVRSEVNLQAAYALGREAVSAELAMLEVCAVHHEALASALAAAPAAEDVQQIVQGASDFLLECLSAYEVAERAGRGARRAAALAQRQARMLRQLSSFLGDASLALDADDSLREMLALVAEHVRELIACERCVVTAFSGHERVLSAVSPLRLQRALASDWPDVPAVIERPLERGDSPYSLSHPLTALDGRSCGSIRLDRYGDRAFTDADHAMLAHVGQMVSAALERAFAYPQSRSR